MEGATGDRGSYSNVLPFFDVMAGARAMSAEISRIIPEIVGSGSLPVNHGIAGWRAVAQIGAVSIYKNFPDGSTKLLIDFQTTAGPLLGPTYVLVGDNRHPMGGQFL